MKTFGNTKAQGLSVYVGGKKKNLDPCPFFECGSYHLADRAICPKTGRSIIAERAHWQKVDKRKELAKAAREKYENEHFPKWRRKIPAAVLSLIFLSAFSSPFIPSERIKAYIVIGAAICFVIAFPWITREGTRWKAIKMKADEAARDIGRNKNEDRA